MDSETPPVKRSRRELLAAGLGAAAAAVVGALGRPDTANAADGGALILGNENYASGVTYLYKLDDNFGGHGLDVSAHGPGTAVMGHGDTGGSGVFGESNVASGYGLRGVNSGGTAVSGRSYLAGFSAVSGDNDLGFGVLGSAHFSTTSGTGTAGVWGRDYAASHGIGVYGTAQHGIGVYGKVASTANQNVPASPTGDIAVLGEAAGASSIGVKASNSSGVALYASGKVHFSRSGRVTILAGKSSVKVTLSTITTSSMLHAMLQKSASGRYVRAVVPSTGYFTIYLNTTVSSNTTVAWFALD
jgi:hypothetical protein